MPRSTSHTRQATCSSAGVVLIVRVMQLLQSTWPHGLLSTGLAVLVRAFLQEGHNQTSFLVLESGSVEKLRGIRVWREYECGWSSCDAGHTGKDLGFFVSAEGAAVGVRDGVQNECNADLEESA